MGWPRWGIARAADARTDWIRRLRRKSRPRNDPGFETKAADVIGLYLTPPTNAVIFSVDEKSHIQALDRLDPVLPLSPGRAERHGFEYKRNGTLSLFAAVNVATGHVDGMMTATRHTSAEFLRFLDRLVATQSARREIHIIADNLSAHKTKAVTAWLTAHPRVTGDRAQSGDRTRVPGARDVHGVVRHVGAALHDHRPLGEYTPRRHRAGVCGGARGVRRLGADRARDVRD